MLTKLPGLIDVHVHLREFGATHKEDFYTGTSAALAGGYTTVIEMPNNPQPTVSLKAIARKKKLAAKKCVCDYGFYFGANNSNWKVHPAAAKKTFGIKIFMNSTTSPLLVEKLEILKNHFGYGHCLSHGL
jgi:dihydroorotase